jgi:hypothetical protein
VEISGNTIGGNTTGASGGGIYCSNSSAVILNNKVTGNRAENSANGAGGGGIYCEGGALAIHNNAFISNTTASYGGGIRFDSTAPAISGNTIAGNTAGSGGGLSCWGGTAAPISNNVVAFNSSGVYLPGGVAPTLRNNCVYNPSGANYSGLAAGTGDISLDPLFVNRQGGDYRSAPGSPCIDAGYNAAVPASVLTELDGHGRFFNDPATPDCRWAPGSCGTAPIVDMGAYEFIAGDYDRDGDLDTSDLNVFRSCISGPLVAYASGCAKADFDRDGDVDLSDFGVLQRCYSGAGRLVAPGCSD